MKEDWKNISIDVHEAERYLGYRRIQPDDTIRAMIQECILDLENACTPRSVMGEYPVVWGPPSTCPPLEDTPQQSFPDNASRGLGDASPAGNSPAASRIPVGTASPEHPSKEHSPTRSIRIAGMDIHSRSLERNMKGCTRAILFAATLGEACDRLVRRAEITSMTRAAIYQSTGAAMIEAYANKVNKDIINEARKRNLYCRPRFSPGYGDLPLSLQKDFFRILDITRRIGVSLSDSLLMTPTKSITAIIGLSPTKVPCILQGCEVCNLHEHCEYARG